MFLDFVDVFIYSFICMINLISEKMQRGDELLGKIKVFLCCNLSCLLFLHLNQLNYSSSIPEGTLHVNFFVHFLKKNKIKICASNSK